MSDPRDAITDPRHRGAIHAYQDRCEGCDFASVGSEFDMKAPDYIKPEDRAEYLAGYRAQVLIMYGEPPSIEDRLRDRRR